MFSFRCFSIFFLCSILIFDWKNVYGFQSVIQRTVEALFKERSDVIYPEACEIIKASPRQLKMCIKDGGLATALKQAKAQAISACEDTFKYDRWNCSLVYNRKNNKNIFNKFYRETAFVYSLIAASLTHTVAKKCASGELSLCSCSTQTYKETSASWQRIGCSDDFKYAKKLTTHFLDFKHASKDPIGAILKQNMRVGINSIGAQLKEVCKCHGFSGSCTTKTCWKRLSPFNSAMGALKKHYHHAVKRRVVNGTIKINKKKNDMKNQLVYLQRTPNLCTSTKGRECKDKNNCATLCCGRGIITSIKPKVSRCKCKMVGCCFVECDTCVEEVDIYNCK